MTSDADPELISLLGEWVPNVMLNLGVKTFKLRLYRYAQKIYFDMPSVVFQAKYLEELCLTRCKLNFNNNNDSINNLLMLSNLQTLDLTYVHISEETLEYILSSCPLIDYLDLNYCELLRTINAKKARNLKHFGYYASSGNESSTGIYVPTTLESIRTGGSPNWFSHPNNIYFSHLKSLHLISVQLSAESFDKFSSNYCPCLENLTLHHCYDFKRFQLSSRSINHLEILIESHINGFKAVIDAPNILYFNFSSFVLPSISLTTTSGEWESYISVNEHNYNDPLWFHDLNELLKALAHSRIHLELCPFEYGHIEDGGGISSYKPLQVEELRFGGFFSSSSFPALLNCLLRTCRPRYIDMSLFSKNLVCAHWLGESESERNSRKPGESLFTILLEEKESTSWKKDLEKFRMEVWDKNAGEWCRVQGTRVPEDSWPDIRFRLKWRELSHFA